jgi:uncharacterized protein
LLRHFILSWISVDVWEGRGFLIGNIVHDHNMRQSMSDDLRSEIATLLQPMVKKVLWVVLSTARVPSSEMEPHAPAHLEYMNRLEQQGLLWGSGPFVVPGVTVGDGLTIFNVATEADARKLMDAEPLTSLGMRTYEIHKWELREGRIPVDLLCSQSKFVLR